MSLPAPKQPLDCGNPDCALPSGGRCARLQEFADPLADCPSLARVAAGDVAEPPAVSLDPDPEDDPGDPGDSAPWIGGSLGPAEVDELLHRRQPIVLAVLGPHKAGKTCLLTALFLRLANGQRAGFPYRFASSRSLFGFHGLAERANRWDGDADAEIVQRTPTTGDSGRFLHLGLRPVDERDDRHLDLLLSDLPGEWVTEWAVRQDPVNERRLAFFDRADGILLLADARRVADERTYANEIAEMFQRVAERLLRREGARPPLHLVFTKIDLVDDVPVEGPPTREVWGPLGAKRARRMWNQIRTARERGLTVAVHGVSAFPRPMADGAPLGVMRPFTSLVVAADRREIVGGAPPSVAEGASAFESLRIWRAV